MEELQELIDFYGLDIEMINALEAAIIRTVESALEDEEPVLFYGWRPHSMFENMM